MLDFVGSVAIVATIFVCLGTLVGVMRASLVARLTLAVVLGAWIGLAAALGSAGEFADAGRRPVPLIGIMMATPLVVAALIAWLWPAARRALLGVPMSLLIALNVPRLIGGMFLLLAAAGRLSGPFPVSAGWGDLIAAVGAIFMVRLALRPTREGDRWIHAWNVFGALDFVAAVGFATVSTPGSPLQIIDAGMGPQAMQYLPWALIPTVLVPYWLIAHAIVFAQLRARAQ
jgi:hypothetical protein